MKIVANMKHTLLLITALLLSTLAALQPSYFKTPRVVIAPFSTSAQSQPQLNP